MTEDEIRASLRELKAALDESDRGVAALGLCIARTLAEQNPTLLERLAQEAQKMSSHLLDRDQERASRIVLSFALALSKPERFPGLTPGETKDD